MKKLVKVLSLLALSIVVCLGVVAFAACSGEDAKTYKGEYSYKSYGHTYGMVVNVSVADGKITKVEDITGNTYVSVSTPPEGNEDWTDASVKNWKDNLPKLLKKYEGKTVEEVKALTATIKGVEEATENKVSDSNLVITDATQGSARLLLAVQNALKDVK